MSAACGCSCHSGGVGTACRQNRCEACVTTPPRRLTEPKDNPVRSPEPEVADAVRHLRDYPERAHVEQLAARVDLAEVQRHDLARQFHEQVARETPFSYAYCICDDVHDTQTEEDNTRLAEACNANSGRIAAWIAQARAEALLDAVVDAAQSIALIPLEHGLRAVVAGNLTGHSRCCVCVVCEFIRGTP
jgi:urocanate hydratase